MGRVSMSQSCRRVEVSQGGGGLAGGVPNGLNLFQSKQVDALGVEPHSPKAHRASWKSCSDLCGQLCFVSVGKGTVTGWRSRLLGRVQSQTTFLQQQGMNKGRREALHRGITEQPKLALVLPSWSYYSTAQGTPSSLKRRLLSPEPPGGEIIHMTQGSTLKSETCALKWEHTQARRTAWPRRYTETPEENWSLIVWGEA